MGEIRRGSAGPWTSERSISATTHISRLEDRHTAKLLHMNEQDEKLGSTYSWDEGGILRDLRQSNRQSLQTGIWTYQEGFLSNRRLGLPKSVLRELITEHLLGLSPHGPDHGSGSPYARHKDLKPSNIFVFGPHVHTQDRWKIGDFGLTVVSTKSLDATTIGAQTLTYRLEEDRLGGPSKTPYSSWRAFAEVLARLFPGVHGVRGCLPSARALIIDPHDAQSGAFLDDRFFTLEKGILTVRPSISDVGLLVTILQSPMMTKDTDSVLVDKSDE